MAFAGCKRGNSLWHCRCECGKTTTLLAYSLKNGHTKSCGCLAGESHGERVGGQNSAEYRAYFNAKERCENPRHKNYKDYGRRGVTFRFESFGEFLAEVGRRPSSAYSIDRKDNNGHYEKGNVKWSTRTEQGRNKRNNAMVEVDGVSRCVADWSELTGISKGVIATRIRRNWCGNCAVTITVRGGSCIHLKRTVGFPDVT